MIFFFYIIQRRKTHRFEPITNKHAILNNVFKAKAKNINAHCKKYQGENY